MSKTPKEIWCRSGLYYEYVDGWSEGSWSPINDGGVKYVRADRIEELEAKLSEQIEWVKSLADDLIAAEGREARLKEKLAKAVEVAEKSIKWLRLYGSDVHREAAALKKLTSSEAAYGEAKGGKDE